MCNDKYANLLIDVLWQVIGTKNEKELDNMCMKPYDEACRFLFEKGYLKRKNDRIYVIKNKYW